MIYSQTLIQRSRRDCEQCRMFPWKLSVRVTLRRSSMVSQLTWRQLFITTRGSLSRRMTKAFSRISTHLLLATTVGCNQSAWLERKAPQDVSLVKSYFDLLRSGHADQVEDLLDPALQSAGYRARFDELVATIPQEAPNTVKAILVDPRCEEGRCEDGIILEYKYGSERLLFNVELMKEGTQLSIIGINLRVIPESFIEANKFTLSNKSFLQYLILALAILLPALSLCSLVLCIRMRIGPRKWVWTAFILLGIFRLGINWTTGHLEFHFWSIHLVSAQTFAQPFEPWVISVSLPLGAILFLINYRSRLFHVHRDGLHQKTMTG